MAKLFDGPRFMNDVTNNLMKTPIAKDTFGQASADIQNWDVKGLARTLDSGIKDQMNVEFERLYSTLPSTVFKETLIKFVVFTNLLVKNGSNVSITFVFEAIQSTIPPVATTCAFCPSSFLIC